MPWSSLPEMIESVDADSSVWDGLLLIGTTVWKKRYPGALPEPGQQMPLGGSLPSVQIVSVVEQRGESVSAALFRLPEPAVRDNGGAERVAGQLRLVGWVPQ